MTDLASEPPTITGTFGKYTLVSELGRGAMGIVYEAIDAELHRTVALKMLLTTSSLTPEDAAQDEERFLREARVCANLPKHPNIVGVHEAGVINGRRYIAMEFVKGRQMSAWSRESGVSLRRKIGVLRDTAFAIEHAHRHRVVHRDLKPHNVLIDAEGRPHVMDFGLAKRMTETPAEGHLTIQGVVAGTPAYMSPEQAEGRRDVDHRTDIYAMGIMLFEILADRVPFIGTTPFKVMVKVVQDPMPSPAALAESKGLPTVDPVLERICLKAVAKKPAERYASAGEFAADLSRWLEGQRVTVLPPRNPVKRNSGTTAIGLRKPAPSSRGGLVAAAVAGTLVLALVAALVLRDPPPSDRTVDDAAEAHRAQAKVVSQLLEEAEAQTAAGRHSAALVTYGKVLARDPRNPAAIAGQHDAERRIEAEKSTAASAAAAAEKAKIKEAEPVRAPKPPEDPPPARPVPPSLAAAAVDAATLAPGLVADYYSDRELGQLAVSRLDPAIDFRWSAGPAWPGGPSQSFSARWRGFLRVPKSGLYTLQITSDDGARLFLDETLVVANWKEHREETDSVPVGLDEGLHALRVEYYQGGGDGVIRLAWSEAGEAARVIPAELLLHKASGFKPFPAPSPAPSPAAALPPPGRLAALLAEQRDRLRGQTVTLLRPGAPEAAATIKEVGARDFTLVCKVAGGGTLETVETVDSLSPATLVQIARRAWPTPSAEQLRLLCTVIADRGEIETAWKEAERAKAAGGDARDTIALLLDRERVRTDGLKTTAEKSAAIKKTLATRGPLLDEDQKKLLASDLAAGDQPARLTATAFKFQERPPLAGHEGEVRGVAFSPDGKLLASAGYDSSLRLWDAASGQPRGIMNQGSPVWRAAFSPDGKTLAASDSAKRVKLWDPVSGAERLTCSGHANQVVGVAFSPNGQCLASASTDNSARVWDPSTGKEKALLPNHAKGALEVSFSPDGRLLAVATADHQVQIWDWAKAEIKASLTSHTNSIGIVSFSPDGRSLLTGSRDGTLKLWEAATGKERLTLNASATEVCGGAFSPDGRLVASLSKDGMLKLWEAASGKELLSLKAHTDYGRHLAFSPTGRMVATAGGTPSLRIFDLVGLPPSKP